MRLKRDKIEIYNTRLFFIECNDVDELKEFFRENTKDFEFDDDSIYAHCIWSSYKEDDKLWAAVYLVFNPENEYNSITAGTIAHEAFHAASFIFQQIGVDSEGYCNSEPFAYLIDHISDMIEDFLKVEHSVLCPPDPK